MDFNELIHRERSTLLRTLGSLRGPVLSAGCSGAWYFDWFQDCTGYKSKHVGVELYSPKPDMLPPNVTWIQNSVGDMRDVPTNTFELVFSGQNIEHLAASDVYRFLLEANRTLKNDGLLVIDSPNRSVTMHLGYVQPQHTLEFSVDEICRLLAFAGFEIQERYGIWLMLNEHGVALDFSTDSVDTVEIESRCSLAKTQPEKSFIWWVVARKKRDPDVNLLFNAVSQLFARSYSGFVSARFQRSIGALKWDWGAAVVLVQNNEAGYALFGPYIPLSEGNYCAVFHLRSFELSLSEKCYVRLDVASNGGTQLHAEMRAELDPKRTGEWHTLSVDFSISSYATGVETRVYCEGFNGAVLFNTLILPRRSTQQDNLK
jgi:SAM-dependent methyltransferase